MKVKIIKETDNVLVSKGDICEVLQENETTYFLKHNGMVLQMLKCDCEVIKPMKVKAKIVNKDIDQNREFEVLEEHANCYILKYYDRFLTVRKEWCEVVEDDKETIYKTETVEKEYELTEKQFREKCKENSREGKFEKDIELPNEFYFKTKFDEKNIEYKAINNCGGFDIFKKENYVCSYSFNIVKDYIKKGLWFNIDKPTVNKVEFDKATNCNNCYWGINEETEKCKDDVISICKENNYKWWKDNKTSEEINEKYLDVKKVSKFIKLTTLNGFTNYIAKDKIISVVEYNDQTHIATLDTSGDYIVIDKVNDVIKMLEE